MVKKDWIFKLLLIVTTVLFGIVGVEAQINPDNPAEPNLYYKVSVSANPTGVSY